MSRLEAKMLFVVLLAGMLPLGVNAQSKVDDPFRFYLGVAAEFTDNRDSSADKVSCADYYFGPKFEYNGKPDEAASLNLNYNPVYKYRTKPSIVQNDSELYHNANLSLRNQSSEILETRLIDYFNYTDDPSVTQGGTLYRRDSSFMYNSLEAGMHKILERSNAIDLSALYALKRFDEQAVSDQSDEDKYAVKGLYLLQYRRNSAIAFEGEVGGTSYKEISGLDRSFMSALGSIGFERIATPTMRMGGRVGAQFVSYSDSDLGSEVAPAVNLSLAGSTIPTVQITASVDRRIRESDVFPFASQTATDLRGAIDWTLKEKSMTLHGAVTYHMGEYSEDALPRSTYGSISGDETGSVLEGGFSYTYNTATIINLLARLEDVSSDESLSSVSYPRSFDRGSFTVSVARQF